MNFIGHGNASPAAVPNNNNTVPASASRHCVVINVHACRSSRRLLRVFSPSAMGDRMPESPRFGDGIYGLDSGQQPIDTPGEGF
jgi:hypothetical protein